MMNQKEKQYLIKRIGQEADAACCAIHRDYSSEYQNRRLHPPQDDHVLVGLHRRYGDDLKPVYKMELLASLTRYNVAKTDHNQAAILVAKIQKIEKVLLALMTRINRQVVKVEQKRTRTKLAAIRQIEELAESTSDAIMLEGGGVADLKKFASQIAKLVAKVEQDETKPR